MTINLDEITKALGEITQGEWFVDPEGPEYSVNYKGPLNTFRHVAMVSCYIQRHGDKEENEANAHLIANAPEWLRLLVERVRVAEQLNKDFIDAWENYDMHPGLVMAFRDCGKSYKDAFGEGEST